MAKQKRERRTPAHPSSDIPLDELPELPRPTREQWLRLHREAISWSALIKVAWAVLEDSGLEGQALDEARDRVDTDALRQAVNRLPEMKRGKPFDHAGPGRPKGPDALIRLLLAGVKAGHLPSPLREESAAATEESIAEYLEPRVGGGVVVSIEDEDKDGKPLRAPWRRQTKQTDRRGTRAKRTDTRTDTRITWITDAGNENKTWVCTLRKRLIFALRK